MKKAKYQVEIPEKWLVHFVPLSHDANGNEYASYNDILSNIIHELKWVQDNTQTNKSTEIAFLEMLKGNFRRT